MQSTEWEKWRFTICTITRSNFLPSGVTRAMTSWLQMFLSIKKRRPVEGGRDFLKLRINHCETEGDSVVKGCGSDLWVSEALTSLSSQQCSSYSFYFYFQYNPLGEEQDSQSYQSWPLDWLCKDISWRLHGTCLLHSLQAKVLSWNAEIPSIKSGRHQILILFHIKSKTPFDILEEKESS